MAVSKGKKAHIASELQTRFTKSKSVIFADIQGLKVKEMEELRNTCRTEGVSVMVSKKTLIKRAMTDMGVEELDPKSVEGEIAVIFGYEDEVAPAKLVAKFAKTHDAVKMRAGVIMSAAPGSKFMDAKAVAVFAALPSKQELLAKMVGSLASPLRGLVGVMQGVPRSFVQVLNAISESKS